MRTTEFPGQGEGAPPDAADGAGHPLRRPDGGPLDEKAPAGPSQEMAPSGETGLGSTQEDMAVKHHVLPPDAPPSDGSCPDEEDIAALLDGTLPAGHRPAILEHVASCESCSEIFAGALRFEVDEGHRVSPQTPQQRPFERADRRRDRWSIRSRAWRRGAAAAVAAVLVASLGLLLVRGSAGDLSTESLSADLMKSPAGVRMGPLPRPHMRGPGGEKEMPQNLADFRLGVRLLDLRLALAGGKKDDAADTLHRLGIVLRAMDFVPHESVEAFDRMQKELNGDTPPAALLPKAAAEEKKLADAGVEGQFVDLGRWTEACRLGAAARQENVFHSRAARRLLDQAPALGEGLPGSGDGPNQQAAGIWREIKTAAGRLDFDVLGKRCTALVDQLDADD